MAVSTLKHMLMQNQLRRGDGLHSVPDARRTERLLQTGRTKYSQGVKIEKVEQEEAYDVRTDSCIKAFVRLLARAASERHADPSPSM